MDKLRAMKLFTRLAESGSYTAVADEINATASFVSKEIKKLEEEVGARLLHRSTRKLQLTPIGEAYLFRCREIVMQVDSAEANIQRLQNNYEGKLRVNAPMALGLTDLSAFFAEYMRCYPQVELDIHLSDENLDLVEHGFDLGFRLSSQTFNTNYIGKPLRDFTYRVCVSPKYLETHPPIQNPSDLLQHNGFVYSYFKGGNHWPVGEGVEVKGNLKVNNTIFMREAIESGLGIGFLPSFVADESIKKGALVEILNHIEKPQLTLYALYPNRQFVPPILSRCIELLDDWFSK